MRKLLLTLLSGAAGISAAAGQAEMPMYRNTIRAGIDWMGLPNHAGFHYQFQYARHLRNDRLVAYASVGYLKVVNMETLYHPYGPDVVVYGRPIKRITFDATFAYDFLPSRRHALRFGIGPSIWYREDQSIKSSFYRWYSDGRTDIKVVWNTEQGLAIGGHGMLEYEYWLARRTTAGLRLGLAGLSRHDGIIAIMGATVGYRL